MVRPLYIFDLDGTVALIEHRRHFVECERDKQDWKAFYAACVDDKPNTNVIRTLGMLDFAGCETWIFSGRSDEVREQTMTWLRRHGLNFLDEEVMMRKAGDYTPDDKLKKRWLDGMLDVDRQRLVAVFEDRARMVKMWRENGVTCFQVAEGDF